MKNLYADSSSSDKKMEKKINQIKNKWINIKLPVNQATKKY